MNNYKPIPIPPRLIWREFVARYLPIIVFFIVLFVALALWIRRLTPATVLGEAESIQAIVNAPETGILTELTVRGLQQVKAGEVLGKIVVNDPKTPLVLTSPIEGSVTYLHATVGDRVKSGFPVLTIVGNKPDRIVAFLRQPIVFVPQEDAPVKVRPRARQTAEVLASVQRVGAQLVPIRQTLQPLAARGHTELGLPVIVNVPPGLKLFPGETVELTFLRKPAPQPATLPSSPQAPTNAPSAAPKTNAPPPATTNAPAPAATEAPKK